MHGFFINQLLVESVVLQPDLVDYSRLPELIAQGMLDERRVLRVVYREEHDEIIIITFYPGRRSQYEKVE